MKKHKVIFFTLLLLSALIWLPLIMLLGNSFMGETEILEHFNIILTGNGRKIKFSFFPDYPTLRPYIELLFDSPGFFVMFWNSSIQVFGILFGECLIAVPAAWAFGRFNFYGKNFFFMMYMILMIMPFQVTMVPSYLVLDNFGFLDSHAAIIVPGIFSAFPVFIMSKFFKSISPSLIEAAKIDGAGELQIFCKIALPLGYPGIMSAMVLGFLEYWNTIEQPLTFLRTKSNWPLSLYLPNITADKVNVAFAASIVMMLPAVLLFLWGQSYLEQGIEASGLKE